MFRAPGSTAEASASIWVANWPSGISRTFICWDSVVTAELGRPPDQKKASIRPSRSWVAQSSMPSGASVRSFAVRPESCSTRSAISATPESGWPVPTRMPRRSWTEWIGESVGTTSWT